jgi:tRNA (cytosine38-C5)-methyltransferase
MRVIEFFSGIGGWHFAFEKVMPDKYEIIDAFDINNIANDVYKCNFNKSPSSVSSLNSFTNFIISFS